MESMYIINGLCWKCNEPLKVAVIRSFDIDKRGGTTSGPEAFSQEEIELASSKGANIEKHYSYDLDEEYLANSCKCGAFIGQFHLFKQYFNPAEMGRYSFEKIDLLF